MRKPDRVTKPDKQAVREWMSRPHAKGAEVPPLQDIRRELGWYMIRENQRRDEKR